MTLKEIYYSIISPIENGLPNQGNTYWKKQIYADIHNWRALMIRRQLEQNLRTNNVAQEIDVTLQEYNNHSIQAKSLFIDEIIAKNNATVYVSTTTLPTRIQIKGYPELNFVGTDTFQSIDVVTTPALRYTSFEKWTNGRPKVTLINNFVYLILTGNDSIDQTQDILDTNTININDEIVDVPTSLHIRAIFSNPLDSKLNLTDEDEYPLPIDLCQQLIESLIKKYEAQRNRPQDQSGLQVQENISR